MTGADGHEHGFDVRVALRPLVHADAPRPSEDLATLMRDGLPAGIPGAADPAAPVWPRRGYSRVQRIGLATAVAAALGVAAVIPSAPWHGAVVEAAHGTAVFLGLRDAGPATPTVDAGPQDTPAPLRDGTTTGVTPAAADGTPASDASAPGLSGDAPGLAGTTPGQSGETPANGAEPPGQAGTTPGQSGTAPGKAGTTPGKAGTTPGKAGTTPGQSGDTPGEAGTTPGQSGTAPGKTGDTPAQGGQPPGLVTDPPGVSGDVPVSGAEPPGQSGTAPGQAKRP